MAAWLLRAIVTENVAARAGGVMLDLPVAPSFRLDKEVKNIVTVSAKTSHYWLEHMPRAQQRAIAELLASLDRVSPLVTPATGWQGVECPDAPAAIWMMRALVAQNVLARREAQTLFVPLNPTADPGGVRVRSAVARVQQLAGLRRQM
jgi:hypothetical protein